MCSPLRLPPNGGMALRFLSLFLYFNSVWPLVRSVLKSFLVGCLAVRVSLPEHKVFGAVSSICLAHPVSWAFGARGLHCALPGVGGSRPGTAVECPGPHLSCANQQALLARSRPQCAPPDMGPASSVTLRQGTHRLYVHMLRALEARELSSHVCFIQCLFFSNPASKTWALSHHNPDGRPFTG